MFVKVTRSGGRAYIKLVEAFRDDAGQPRQRVIATLGRLEQVRAGAADALVNGLRRVAGGSASAAPASDLDAIRFSTALSVGDTWLLTALWHRLGFGDAFRRVLRNGRTSFDCERLLRVMVFNRLCDATSKLGVLRWLEMSRVPAVDTASVTHQRLLRAMDTLAERADALQHSLSVLLRPLIDQELSVVFYDLTTVGVEGASELPGDVRDYGMSKDGGVARQLKRRLTKQQPPVMVIEESMRRHAQDQPERKGSEPNDTHLLCLAPYADRTFVDKRTLESARRARNKSPMFDRLTTGVARARDCAQLAAVLTAQSRKP